MEQMCLTRHKKFGATSEKSEYDQVKESMKGKRFNASLDTAYRDYLMELKWHFKKFLNGVQEDNGFMISPWFRDYSI
jgi:hypothetical protein